jgi:hypothetical protein
MTTIAGALEPVLSSARRLQEPEPPMIDERILESAKVRDANMADGNIGQSSR